MAGCLSVTSLFTATICCYICAEPRCKRISSQRLFLPLSLSVLLTCLLISLCNVFHSFSYNLAFREYSACWQRLLFFFQWVMMLWHRNPLRYQRYVCPNRSVFILLMSSFFYNSKRNIYHVKAALPSSLLHLFYHKKFLILHVDALKRWIQRAFVYILLNTTFLFSEIFH
jgi:hypothetical protein